MDGNRTVSLEVDGEFVCVDPSVEQLRTTVDSLIDDADSFFILSVSDQTYLQGTRQAEGLYLEYRDGGPKQHYAVKRHLTLDAALAAMAAYARGDDSWREACEWEQLEL